VDREQLNNLYVLRDALESCAAGEAARNISSYQLEELEALLEEARVIATRVAANSKKHATKRQMNLWLDNEQRFHELLVESAHNPLLAKVVHEHRAIGEVFDAQRNDPQLLPAEVAEYTCAGRSDLIDALRQRDHSRARQLTSEQIQRGREQVLGHLRRGIASLRKCQPKTD
jgi:DNA-binding GntR family transcriptional regulator